VRTRKLIMNGVGQRQAGLFSPKISLNNSLFCIKLQLHQPLRTSVSHATCLVSMMGCMLLLAVLPCSSAFALLHGLPGGVCSTNRALFFGNNLHRRGRARAHAGRAVVTMQVQRGDEPQFEAFGYEGPLRNPVALNPAGCVRV